MKAGSVLALLAGFAATPSFAGSYGGQAYGAQGYGNACLTGPDCSPGVTVTQSRAHFDDVLVSIKQPMGHLRSIDYRRSPHVSVTRIHGLGDVPVETDYPSSFSGGCHPESLTYCQAGGATPAPVMPAPVIAQPIAAPVMRAPVMHAPVRMTAPAPALRQWTASYDDNPARFTPRQYGSLDFVPGIAHVPSSWVDRDPGRAQAALNASGAGGIAPGPRVGLSRIADDTPGPFMPIGQLQGPAPVQPGSIVQPGPASMSQPREVYLSHARQPVMQAPVLQVPMLQAPMMQAPMMQAPMMQAPMMSAPVAGRAGPPLEVSPGVFGSTVGADGTYWEKVSGPTVMGSTIATQVICKRALPQQTVNPVVGVPVAVPYAVDACGPVHNPAQHGSLNPAPATPPAAMTPAYQTHGLAGGVWTQ